MGKVQKKNRKILVVRSPASATLPRSVGRRGEVRLSREPGPVDPGLIVPIDKGAKQRREERTARYFGTGGTKAAQSGQAPVADDTAASR